MTEQQGHGGSDWDVGSGVQEVPQEAGGGQVSSLLCSAGDRTQGRVHAAQALGH